MSDKEDSTASLGYSEMLSAKDAPSERVASFVLCNEKPTISPFSVRRLNWGIVASKSSHETAKGVSAGRENTGDLLPHNPLWLDGVDCSHVFKGEVSPRVFKALAQSRNAEGLARGASANKSHTSIVFTPVYLGDVSQVGDFRVMMGKHRACEVVNLGESHRLPSKAMRGYTGRLYSAETRYIIQSISSGLKTTQITKSTTVPDSRRAAQLGMFDIEVNILILVCLLYGQM